MGHVCVTGCVTVTVHVSCHHKSSPRHALSHFPVDKLIMNSVLKLPRAAPSRKCSRDGAMLVQGLMLINKLLTSKQHLRRVLWVDGS